MLLYLLALAVGGVALRGGGTCAARQGYGDVVASNALGSNIVNLCLVPGLGGPLVGPDIRDRRLPPMIAVTPLTVVPIVSFGLYAVHVFAPRV